jgi:acetyltransferase-like isoleucine patch superfamily enzyme
MNFLYSECLMIFKVDILRARTKLLLFAFNIVPDLYAFKVIKNTFLWFAGMRFNVVLTYIKNGLYCDNLSKITIGKGSFLNKNVYFEGEGKVSLGCACQIGPYVQFVTTNHTDRKHDETLDIVVGNNVWIGAGSIILPGTIIGDNITIAAGSIVRGSLGDGKLWAGTLAEKKK